jgi:hypothetical protein
MRIAALASGYAAAGPPLEAAPAVEYASFDDAAGVLGAAVAAEDLDAIDAAATWLGARATADELIALLGSTFLARLSAAGHANIYLALLARTQPRGLPGQMLRHPARAVGTDSGRAIALPPVRPGRSAPELLTALSGVEPVGPPAVPFIAPLVEHAQRERVFDALLANDGTFPAPDAVPFALLRVAAHAMLQGPPDHAPYGWTHCLTLAQAPLLVAAGHRDAAEPTFVAMAYIAAHWAGYGTGCVDLDHVPDRTELRLEDALTAAPSLAASAAWHAPDAASAAAVLATAASRNHDAHRVKYTLACLVAAACDRPAAPLYLASAAYLNAWWEAHGDASDPLPELAHGLVSTP